MNQRAAHSFYEPEAQSLTAVVLRFPSRPPRRQPPRATAETIDRRRLDLLRRLAEGSRLTARCDPYAGCRLLNSGGEACPRRCAMRFFRLLRETAAQSVEFHVVGTAATTSDEQWMLRLLERLEHRDVASAQALVGFRIARRHRRRMLGAATELLENLSCLEFDAGGS